MVETTGEVSGMKSTPETLVYASERNSLHSTLTS
jgi:hypothetical protein